jgi:hypothetical protein
VHFATADPCNIPDSLYKTVSSSSFLFGGKLPILLSEGHPIIYLSFFTVADRMFLLMTCRNATEVKA